MDSMEIDDNVSTCENLTMRRLITPDFQRRRQTSRCAAVCLGLLCAVLLAGNIGQIVNYEMNIRSKLADLMHVDYNTVKHLLQNDTLTVEKEQLKSNYEALTAERKQLLTRLSNLTKEKDQLLSSYDSLAKEREELQTIKLALTTERNEFKASVNNLTNERDQFKESYNVLQQEKEQLYSSYNAIRADHDALTESKTQLQNNYEIIQREKDELQTRFSTLEANSDRLKSNYSSLKREKDQLQRKYNTLNLSRDLLQTSYGSLWRDKEKLQSDCTTAQRQNQQLQASRNQLQKTVNEMEAKVRGMYCQTGWRKFGISCYFISASKKNWTESRKACIAEGADLVIINSKDEQVFVNWLLDSGENAWIGLTDSGTEGEWKWVDGTPVTTTYWQPGQPNSKFMEQDCGEIVHNSSVGDWNDDGCFAAQIWICEK